MYVKAKWLYYNQKFGLIYIRKLDDIYNWTQLDITGQIMGYNPREKAVCCYFEYLEGTWERTRSTRLINNFLLWLESIVEERSILYKTTQLLLLKKTSWVSAFLVTQVIAGKGSRGMGKTLRSRNHWAPRLLTQQRRPRRCRRRGEKKAEWKVEILLDILYASKFYHLCIKVWSLYAYTVCIKFNHLVKIFQTKIAYCLIPRVPSTGRS